MSIEMHSEEGDLLNRLNLFTERFKGENVGSDIDGVDVLSQKGALSIINSSIGTKFTISDLEYDFSIVELLTKHSKDPESALKFASDIWNGEKNLHDSPPVSGAPILSKFLHNNGIDVARITSRPAYTRNSTIDWYRNNMPWVDPKLLNIQPDLNEINPDFKINRIRELHIDYFFEDSYEHAINIVKKTNAIVIVVPQPWNLRFINDSSNDHKNILIPHKDWTTPGKLMYVYLGLMDIL